MNMKKILFVISFIGLITACNNIKNQNSNTPVYNQEKIEETGCEEIIYKIVQSSNLDLSMYSEYFIRIDRIENNIIFIQIYFKNNTSDNNNTKQIVESTIAWLSLNITEKELYNITFAPDQPQKLIFDKKLLDIAQIKKKCNIISLSQEEKNCIDIFNDDSFIKEVCKYPITNYSDLYSKIKDKVNSDFLLKELPSKDTLIQISYLTNIKYEIMKDTILIRLSYESGGDVSYKIYATKSNGFIEMSGSPD